MVDPVGFRFRPTDEEIVEHYVRPKNVESNTSHVDEVMNTVDIYSFDPWELPRNSRIKSTDHVWYFFGCKKNQHVRNRGGERQSRKTKSGFWKKTGVTMNIMRKRGNGEKIGEKRVLVFLSSESKSKSDWVMHEYVATFLSPNQTMMTTYTVCKVMFKGDARELSSDSGGGDIEHDQDQSLIPHVNNSCGGLSTETEESSFTLQNPFQYSGFLHMEEEARQEDATLRAINNQPTDDWKSFLNDDNGEGKVMFMQENRNNYKPKKPLTGFFIGHSDDDGDYDSISATTCSIQTSTCVSFGSSNHRIDQIKDLQESPSSTIELVSVTLEVSKALRTTIATSEKKMNPYDDAQGSIGGDQMGQEMVLIKNRKAGFIYRMIQRFTKKLKLCSCVSRT